MSEEQFEDELEEHLPGKPRSPMARRFRGFLPVVIDVECGGFNSATDALLEIAAVTIGMDEQGLLYPRTRCSIASSPSPAPTSSLPRWNSPASSSTTHCAWPFPSCRR